MAFNPFTVLPPGLCDDMPLPDFSTEQDCTTYDQELSEVCGLIVVPDGASIPTNWQSFPDWNTVLLPKIVNTNPAKAHYLVGIGSFLPTEKTTLILAGGRVEENREHRYRLNLSVKNMHDGHAEFARSLMANKKDFTFFLHTMGDRVIGGPEGMNPVFVDAEFPFGSGESTEQITIIIDTEFIAFPEW